MPLSPIESLAIKKLSEILYTFLPGTPHPMANQSISLTGVASKLGLQKFWSGGSKGTALSILLSQTYEYEHSSFCKLILEIINTSTQYSKKSIVREEIEEINKALIDLKFKIPELYNPNFLNKLPSKKIVNSPAKTIFQVPESLKQEFISLTALTDEPQKRGYAFEKFLNSVFISYGLNPRESFKLVGEQIDGSIELDSQIYLIEAKWQNKMTSSADLYCFSGKISRKAKWTRGIFISYTGFTEEAIQAYQKGHPADFILMNGQDLHFILSGESGYTVDLLTCIKEKSRHAAETGNIMYTVIDILRSKTKN